MFRRNDYSKQKLIQCTYGSFFLSLLSPYYCLLLSSSHYNSVPLSPADSDSQTLTHTNRKKKVICIRIPPLSFHPSLSYTMFVLHFQKLDIYWGQFELQQQGWTICSIRTSIASAFLYSFTISCLGSLLTKSKKTKISKEHKLLIYSFIVTIICNDTHILCA